MSLLGLLSFSECGVEACMAASSGRTAICLGASRARNCLTAGCKDAAYSSGQTGINNNVPAVTRGSVLHGHEQCIKNRAQKTNKYKGTASDCSPAQSLQQQKGHIVMSRAAAA
ncbi:uncharacterized protein LOC142776413 [Rhipicephalus microplus]|uniref:uncharacterized protein LOC142776413 n=1 Tax=Rhipicephalus microplus TaxID=6941 RepID=UPI003F6CD49F